MAEHVIDATPTGSEAPASEAPARPEGVPEKFWDAEKGVVNTEALLKSYSELEKSRTAPADDTAEAADPATAEAAEEATGAEPGSLTPFFEEFSTSGALGEESYAKLAAMGFDKEVVDTYIRGHQAAADSFTNDVVSAVGGAEAATEVRTWAAEARAQDPELNKLVDAFNKAIETNDAVNAKLSLAAIQAAYTKANGKEPARDLTNGKPGSSMGGYSSHDEYMLDVKNAEYKTNQTFRDKVAARLAKTTAF